VIDMQILVFSTFSRPRCSLIFTNLFCFLDVRSFASHRIAELPAYVYDIYRVGVSEQHRVLRVVRCRHRLRVWRRGPVFSGSLDET